MNGATLGRGNNSVLKPIINSYDYEAPLTESGDYTEKYRAVKEFIAERNKILTRIPDMPQVKPLLAYQPLQPVGQISLADIIDEYPLKIQSENLLSMEYLPINSNSGQSFGYIVYTKTNLLIPAGAKLKITGYIDDTVLVLVDGKLTSKGPHQKSDVDGFGFWRLLNSTIELSSVQLKNATLSLVVENFGRSSQGSLIKKGLTDPVYMNEQKITNWLIVPLEFKKSWSSSLKSWQKLRNRTSVPALYKFVLKVDKEPKDTYLDMREWNKGIIIVNGFVLSRYFFLGPQLSAYLPAPYLKVGDNNIVVFEHYNAPEALKFSNVPLWDWNITLT